jgi:hypothetical protein
MHFTKMGAPILESDSRRSRTMKKKSKDVLAIVGAEVVAAALFCGAILYLVTKLETGQHVVNNWLNFNVPVAGGLAIFSVLGVVVLILLPRSMWRERNMSKAERKKRRRQDRKAKPSYQKSDIPWH